MRDRAAWQRLAAIGRRQCGVVGLGQTRAAGLTYREVEGLVGRGVWDVPLPGVYRFTVVAPSWRQRVWAATLWVGGEAVASHRTAAALWALDGFGEARPELWVVNPRAPRHAAVTVHRTRFLADVDRAEVSGLPVTAPARTIIDLAGVVPDAVLEAAYESARRRGNLGFVDLAERAAELCTRGRRGSRRIWRLLRTVDGGRAAAEPAAESPLEVRVARVLRTRPTLPAPLRQHEVRVEGVRYRLDFAWPERGVALESDGWSVHGRREAFESDRQRWAALAAAGWRVLFTTWQEVEHRPQRLLDRVERALAHDGS